MAQLLGMKKDESKIALVPVNVATDVFSETS